MTSVTFPTALGGDGSTVSDDSNPSTGLGNGGHRYRFVPSLVQVVAMAQTAVNAANSAVAATGGTSATSATSLTIGVGNKSLTLAQTNKGFSVGQQVLLSSQASPGAFMIASITSFTSSTGAMGINVTSTGGSGTYADWAISVTVPNFGVTGGNLLFQGTGQRITGDFSNATPVNRLMFQTTTANGSTLVGAAPLGSGSQAGFIANSRADVDNASLASLVAIDGDEVRLTSGANGSGAQLPLGVWVNGARRVRLTTDGMMGLGVTPSAWGVVAGQSVFQLGDRGAFFMAGGSGWSSSNSAYLGNNGYYNGGWKYSNSLTGAAQYEQSGGDHNWYSAITGTAGNAISFTQTMKLDLTGNLLLGTTTNSEGARIRVVTPVAATAELMIGVQTSSATTVQRMRLGTILSGGLAQWGVAINAHSDYTTTAATQLSFSTTDSGGNLLERARITDTGNLQFNSGYGSVATAYACRAWVNFNGTGTVPIRASGNVSSITDNGTGDYTVNLTNSMPDSNYCVNLSTERGPGGSGFVNVNSYANSYVRITTFNSGTQTDVTSAFVSIFR